MPQYGDLPSGVGATGAGATALVPGDSLVLVNNEAFPAGKASIVAARQMGPGEPCPVTFSGNFAGPPNASLQVLGSNVAPKAVFTLADWDSLYTATNSQASAYTDTGRFLYYCVYLASQTSGGNLTVVCSR